MTLVAVHPEVIIQGWPLTDRLSYGAYVKKAIMVKA